MAELLFFFVVRDCVRPGLSAEHRQVHRGRDGGSPEREARISRSIGMNRPRARRLGQKREDSTMTEEERAQVLLEQAEERGGLSVAYDSGFLVVTRSASADRRRDDAAEVEQSIIEELGRCHREIFSLAIARARGVRGEDFVGQQVFIPSAQIVGRLVGCSADGTVNVSYRENIHPERISNLNYSGPGQDLLLIVDDERPAPASPTSFSSWIADEKVLRLFERAESVGLSLEHDSGFIVVKWRSIDGVEREVCEATIRQLGQSMREVFVHLVARARGIRGAAFVGQRVFVPEFNAFGVLASSSVDGSITASYHDKHMESDRTVFIHGDGVIILDGIEEAAEASSSASQNSEATWRRLVRRAFGS
jgi:hypothetical protein